MTKPSLAVGILAGVLMMTAGCGGAEPGPQPGGEGDVPATAIDTANASTAPAAPAGARDLSEADLDLYERGFVKEIEIVRAAAERAGSARTAAERAAAMQQQWETKSIPAAARAAGVPEDRYRYVRETVHEIFRTLDFQGKIDGPLSMDMSRASEETKAKLARDPFDALTPSAAAALRTRMDRLVPLWIDYVKMTAVSG